jgi:hypothetical protein
MNEGMFVGISIALNLILLAGIYMWLQKNKKLSKRDFDPFAEVDELVKANEEFVKLHGATKVMGSFSGLIMTIQELHPSNKELEASMGKVIADKRLLEGCMNAFKFANEYITFTKGRIGLVIELPKDGDIIEQFRDIIRDKDNPDLPN